MSPILLMVEVLIVVKVVWVQKQRTLFAAPDGREACGICSLLQEIQLLASTPDVSSGPVVPGLQGLQEVRQAPAKNLAGFCGGQPSFLGFMLLGNSTWRQYPAASHIYTACGNCSAEACHKDDMSRQVLPPGLQNQRHLLVVETMSRSYCWINELDVYRCGRRRKLRIHPS